MQTLIKTVKIYFYHSRNHGQVIGIFLPTVWGDTALIFSSKNFFSRKSFLDYFYAKFPVDFDYDS